MTILFSSPLRESVRSFWSTISERKDLRVEVMSGLRKLINKSKEDGTRSDLVNLRIDPPTFWYVSPTGHRQDFTEELLPSVRGPVWEPLPRLSGVPYQNLPGIQGVLLNSLSSSSPSSKAPRLRCLINIFKFLPEEQKDFLLAVVPEAILCTKEIGEKARSASYLLLVEMGRAKIRWNKDENGALEDYFQMVMAGLGGSPQMVSSTLLALTRILYEFKGLTTKYSQGVGKHKEDPGESEEEEEGKEEESEEESDQEHFKSRQERFLSISLNSNNMDELLRDTDSEEEGETKGAHKPRDRTQAKLAWLQEGGDIMDFLDPSASKKVLATKPGEKREKKTKKKEVEFKTAPDGRLIITESSDEEEPEKMAGDDEELDDLLNAIEQGAGNVKKTKKRKVEDLGSDEEGPSPKYKAGGGGIHRQIVKAKRSAPHDPASEYRAKKAGGDIKKTGKPDPYVYLPLNFQALNKRKMSDQIRKLNTQRKDTQQEPGYFGCGFCEALNIQQRKQGC
uniref:Uncharacterized protein n=1 Tax=Magallana gigas TaxID=29159 RepID=A0A8W8IGX0_MAGGI